MSAGSRIKNKIVILSEAALSVAKRRISDECRLNVGPHTREILRRCAPQDDEKLYLLGVRIDNVLTDEAFEKIRGFLADGRQHHIATPNPDFLVLAQKDEEFKKILNNSDLNLPDGIGLIFASRFLGEPLKGRVVGVDLIIKLTDHDSEIKNAKIFLLGGFNGAAEKIARDCPQVVGFSEFPDNENTLEKIIQRKPDILLVALGAPRQEKWIAQNLAKIPSVRVAIGVGSAFNLLAGQIKRAPKIFQALGLEWFWRLFREPWRWRKAWRSVAVFPLMILRQKII